MSIFGPAHSAQTEEKSKATRWNANSFQILQKCNSFLQPTLKYHHNISVVDLVEAPPPILGKKEEMTEGKKASRARKSRTPPPPPLPEGLDQPLYIYFMKGCKDIFEIIFLTRDLLQ